MLKWTFGGLQCERALNDIRRNSESCGSELKSIIQKPFVTLFQLKHYSLICQGPAPVPLPDLRFDVLARHSNSSVPADMARCCETLRGKESPLKRQPSWIKPSRLPGSIMTHGNEIFWSIFLNLASPWQNSDGNFLRPKKQLPDASGISEDERPPAIACSSNSSARRWSSPRHSKSKCNNVQFKQ